MLEALNREILWREFWEWKFCNVKVTLMLMIWHHEFRYRYDITTVSSFWSLIFKAQLCALTTRRLRFNDAQEWFFFLSSLLSYLCKALHLWIFFLICEFFLICDFFLHLWIFTNGSSSFIRRHLVIHPLLRWISIIKRTSFLKFNFLFFFLQRWRVFNRSEMKNISKETQLLFLSKGAQLLKKKATISFVN